MRVKIGNYPSRLSCTIHSDYMNKKYGWVDWPVEYTPFEARLEKLEDCIQSLYNIVNWLYFDRIKRTVKVRIDPWDTWGMDDTLSVIVLPMLKQLKESKCGAPFVELEDVPATLHAPKDWLEKYNKDGETDPNFFKRWDWVLDEMIFAFEHKAHEDPVYMRYEGEEQLRVQERINNGFLLFGKYFESLWD